MLSGAERRLRVSVFALALAAAACASSPVSLAERPQSSASVVFLESSMFDRHLREAMAGGTSTIVVQFPTPFTTNEIPDRLDAWLSAIDRSGGGVETVPVEQPRGGELLAIELSLRAARRIGQAQKYRPASAYRARLYYEPATGKVARVEFVRK
jgi:hypothetical protein